MFNTSIAAAEAIHMVLLTSAGFLKYVSRYTYIAMKVCASRTSARSIFK